MTSKRHPVTCIALSVAVALKLFVGTAQPPVLQDASGHFGRGIDIARVDGRI